MSRLYHCSLTLGRTDTNYYEATNEIELQEMFEFLSEAEVQNIKEVVFSRKHLIGTSQPLEKFSPKEDAYYKWSFICYSENHTKQLDFFNVKVGTKREDIINGLKSFTINNEPIDGVLDDVRFDFKETIFNTNDLYQVNYRNNSKSFVEDIYSPSIDAIKDFYRNFIAGELVEIRKYEYLNIVTKKDDGNYYKRLGINVISNLRDIYTVIPKIKKSLNFNDVKDKISNVLRFDGKKIDKDKIRISLTD